jgi:two-component system, LytTR family, response regulator
MKAVIVEDSRLARAELKELLKAHDNIYIIGEAENPKSALKLIEEERPELLFMDINMPGKNGFELLAELSYQPKIIFVTAYADYAIRSFEFETVDYLLKPVSAERLKKSIDKLMITDASDAQAEEFQQKLDAESRVLLRDGETCHWVALKDISYFDSCGNHTHVFWNDSKSLIYRSLSKIEERISELLFFRVNRQQIVNVNHVTSVEPWMNGGYRLTLKSGAHIEVSRRHTLRFKDIFSL